MVAGALTALQIIPAARVGYQRSNGISGSAHRRVPMQLPRDLRDFTGRSTEMKWLVKALTTERGTNNAVVISAISGQGGVGKTALALHVSHLLAEQFPHGQIYVNLRGPEAEVLEPGQVLGQLLRELGVSPRAITDDLDGRSRLYRSILGRSRILVVLDNALNEAQVQPLLPGSSTSVVLITSRVSLAGLDGIRSLRLNVMQEEEALRLLADIVGRDRLSPASETARWIVNLCAYLPLAIRIVGSRLAANPRWSPEDFLALLRDRHSLLDHLDDGDRAVRATFDMSYSELDDAATTIFRCLGALTIRTFPEWLLASALGSDENSSMAGLDGLLRADMIGTAGIDRFGVNRYGLHDLLREYSRECLEASPSSDELFRWTVRRTGAAYLANSASADSYLRDTGNRFEVHPVRPAPIDVASPSAPVQSREDALAWFDSELINLLLVIEQQVQSEFHAAAIGLAHSVSAYCEERSLWREWESAQRCAIAAAESLRNDELLCISLYNLGRVHHLLGEWTSAIREINECLEIATRLAATDVQAAALCALGKIYQLGDLDAAMPLFERSRAIYREAGNRHAEAYVTANVADIYHQRGEWELALQEFGRCMPVFVDAGDYWWQANAGIWIGDVFRGQGRFREAVAQLEASLRRMRELGDERRAAVALVHLARTYADFGHGRQAMKAVGSALPTLERVADRWWHAMALVEQGKAHVLTRHNSDALTCWRAALPILQERETTQVLDDLQGRIRALTSES